jgi:outer membrane protein OmpA-like peptidoglycan-associated protein
MKNCKVLAILLIIAVTLFGCAEPMSKTQKGAAYGTGIGAAVGAGLGQAIGGDTKATLLGAGIGAVVGGLAGAGIGNYMEKQEAALQQQFAASEAASVRRDANVLAVTFKSDMLFDSGSAALKSGAYQEINRVAQVLVQYPETRIRVAGHTDADGSEAFNQDLSVRRAENVRNALVAQGVAASRVNTIGFGETQPIADNNTEAGKQLNRRVVVTIEPMA